VQDFADCNMFLSSNLLIQHLRMLRVARQQAEKLGSGFLHSVQQLYILPNHKSGAAWQGLYEAMSAVSLQISPSLCLQSHMWWIACFLGGF